MIKKKEAKHELFYYCSNQHFLLLAYLKQEFEDLDEIIARHIQPMAAFTRDVLNYRYYKDSDGGKREVLDKVLIEDKKRTPSK